MNLLSAAIQICPAVGGTVDIVRKHNLTEAQIRSLYEKHAKRLGYSTLSFSFVSCSKADGSYLRAFIWKPNALKGE